MWEGQSSACCKHNVLQVLFIFTPLASVNVDVQAAVWPCSCRSILLQQGGRTLMGVTQNKPVQKKYCTRCQNQKQCLSAATVNTLYNPAVSQNAPAYSSWREPAPPGLCVFCTSHLRESFEAKVGRVWPLRGKDSVSALLSVVAKESHSAHTTPTSRTFTAIILSVGLSLARLSWEESLWSLTLEIWPPLSHL